MASNQQRLVIPLKSSSKQGYIAAFLLTFTLCVIVLVSVGVWVKCALLAVWLAELAGRWRLIFRIKNELAVTGLSLQKLSAQSTELGIQSTSTAMPEKSSELISRSGMTAGPELAASNLQRARARYQLELRFGHRWERVSHVGELVVTPYAICLSARLRGIQLNSDISTPSSNAIASNHVIGKTSLVAIKLGRRLWSCFALTVTPQANTRVNLVLTPDNFLSDDDFRHLRIAFTKT